MTPETTYPAVLGAVLVRKRKEMGLDQVTVAKKVGVSRTTWSRVENGEVALSIDQLPKVAEVLEYKGGMSELIHNTEKVVGNMKQQGITVHYERISTTEKIPLDGKESSKNKVVKGLSLLSAAALTVWIARVLIRKP